MIDFVAKIYEQAQKRITRYPCKVVRASSIGYFVSELGGCCRRGTLEQSNWADKEMHDVRTQLIFDQGNMEEAEVLKSLAASGIQVIEQQSAFEIKEHGITGHLDGVVLEDGKAIPLEIKSSAPSVFDGLHCIEDFKKKSWTTSYLGQIQIYMYAKGADKAYWLFKNKSSGELRQFEVLKDEELLQACFRTADEINKHVAANTLPDRIDNRETCKQCPFRLICLPEINFGTELKIVDDPQFEARIDKYLNLKEASDECKDEYEIIKGRCKATVAGQKELNVMVGKYQITGKVDVKGSLRINIERI